MYMFVEDPSRPPLEKGVPRGGKASFGNEWETAFCDFAGVRARVTRSSQVKSIHKQQTTIRKP